METGGGETSSSSSPREIGEQETTRRNEIVVTIDPDSLHCSICTNSLCAPLYQCIYGHIACFSCWEKVQYKCSTCDEPIVPQNIALEKMLASIQLLFPNTIYGYCRSILYSQMQMHTETCEFGPSLCPIPGCAHKAFSGEWQAHFLKEHWNPGPHYSEVGSHYNYGEYCAIRFEEEVLYYTLLGPGKDVFLLVKEPIPNVGDSISLYYIDLANLGQYDFSYELEVGGRIYTTNKLRLESQVHSIKEWKRGEVRGSSLLVPLGFTSSQNIKVHVLINKELDEESDTISSERPEEEEEDEEEKEEEEEDKEPPAKKLDEESDTILSERPEEKEEVNAKKGKESKEVKVQEEKEGKKKGKKEEAAAKPENIEKKEAKASTSIVAKEKKKPAAKKQGKEKMSEEVKGPTKEELHAVISELLFEVDFETATLADILRQLGAQFKVDLMDRAAEVKQILEDVINSMSEEEEDEPKEQVGFCSRP